MSTWPNKTVPQFTNAELAAAIEQHQDDPDPVIRDLVRSCTDEWEHRRGIRRSLAVEQNRADLAAEFC
ncbi:hypothetical protein ACIGZJ_36575 [Kitasatospora sp. NPDC052868]|uniref:hypothetical protein n=1 Tax=Kitasatospora sp. NPDC052868 TaxID=3364060 RepID=UPI0037C9AA6A